MIWKDAPEQREILVYILTFGVNKRLADVYDAVLDQYQQNEEAFAHACIRVLVHFGESVNDEQSDEITEMLSEYQGEETGDEEYLEREIVIDTPTHEWLRLISDARTDRPDIVAVFVSGVILTSIMFEVVKNKPSAHLTSNITEIPVRVPIRQLLDARPQFYN